MPFRASISFEIYARRGLFAGPFRLPCGVRGLFPQESEPPAMQDAEPGTRPSSTSRAP